MRGGALLSFRISPNNKLETVKDVKLVRIFGRKMMFFVCEYTCNWDASEQGDVEGDVFRSRIEASNGKQRVSFSRQKVLLNHCFLMPLEAIT